MIAQESFDATSTTNGPGYTDPVTGATAYPLRREEPILSMALPLEAYTQTLTRNGNTNAGFSFTDAINYAGDTSRTILNAAVGFEQAALNTGLSLLQVGADVTLQVGNILTGGINGDDSIIQGALIRQGARGQGIADFLSDPFNNTVNGVVGIGERLGENAAIGGAAGGREFGKAAFDGVSLAFGASALPKTAMGLYGEAAVLGGKTLSIVDEFFSTPSPSGYRAQLGALGDLTGYTAQVGGANRAIPGFSAVESGVIQEARGIIGSTEMAQIRAAHAAGEPLSMNIGGRLVQYEPGLPASGMTMFGENGFLIGREAFASQAELQNTVLHELYRLNTSASASGVSAALAAQETKAAFDFAARAAKHL